MLCIPPVPQWAGSEADIWVGFSVLVPFENPLTATSAQF